MSVTDYVLRPGPVPEIEFIGEPAYPSSLSSLKPVMYRRDRKTIVSYHAEMTPQEAIVFASALLELATGRDRWKHPPV